MTSFIALVCLLQHSLVVLLQYSLVVLQYSSIYHESCHLRSVGWQKSGRRFFCISRDHGSWRAFDYSWCRRMGPSFPRRAKTTPSICIQFGVDSHPGAFRMRDTLRSLAGVFIGDGEEPSMGNCVSISYPPVQVRSVESLSAGRLYLHSRFKPRSERRIVSEDAEGKTSQ